MARLTLITYFALIVTSVLGAAIPHPSLPHWSRPPTFIPASSITNITITNPDPDPDPNLNPVSRAKKPEPEPAPPARRPQQFTPAKIARCVFTLALGPCCGELSNPPPWSQECIDKWGDPDYDRQDEINFCKAQPLGKCTITDMDGVPQNMIPKVER